MVPRTVSASVTFVTSCIWPLLLNTTFGALNSVLHREVSFSWRVLYQRFHCSIAWCHNFFLCFQISQGPDVTSVRNVSTKIEIEEIPYVMRALGFYPSELEVRNYAATKSLTLYLALQIEEMINEVKFSRFVDTGCYVTEIDLGNFIRR